MRRLLIPILLFSFSVKAQKLPTIAEKTKDLKKQEGFLPFYWDENTGKIWLEITRPDTEILYYNSLPAGLGSNDVGLDRGLLGGEKVVKFVRTGRKVLLIEPNYRYRASSTDEAERKAVEQSFAQSAIWGFTVEAESEGNYLVDATDFLYRDAMSIPNRLKASQQGNYTLDKSRTVVFLPRTKNFPQNTEFEITQTFVNSDGNTGNFVQSVTPSPDAITVRVHHSFVQLPGGGYKPRLFDPRSGYYPISYFDYSTPVSEPITRYFITRHRLEKKDPSAAVSEAVEPIIYYLDNGTPEPIRAALLEGGNWWNQAFEAAGYRNAFQVRILPEDADPMDVRYNVINWVHRSTRGWSYGASVIDPRTGEILKGHVTLGSLRVRQDYLIASGLLAPYETGVPADDKMLKMALERLKQLSAHEIGHTLGIMHNYASSVSNRASVMDYPHPMVRLNAAGEIDLSSAYDNKIGEWDKMAIAYGYQDFPNGTNETAALNTILQNGTSKGLQFISDQDARRAGGSHPQAHLWDNGSNAVEELKLVMNVRNKALSNFGQKNVRPGMPLAMLEDALVPVYFYHRYQVEAAAKLVGGMQYSYALRNDGQLVTQVLPATNQRAALNAILDCIDPAFLVIPQRIADLIPPRPAGYDASRELFRKRTGLTFDVLAPAESAAELPLSFLFNSERLNRLQQQEDLNNGFGVRELLTTIVERTWHAPRKTRTEKLIQLQTEQIVLTHLLSASINENNSFVVRAAIRQVIRDLEAYIESRGSFNDPVYRAHIELAKERIKDPDKTKPPPTLPREIPPGAPIGCDH